MHRIKVDKQSIRTIITQYAPTYNIPSFQRRYVWDEDDIKQLIDSVRKNYPIGAVIVWKPNRSFPSVPLFDNPLGAANKASNEYVIDGQQRLTSIMLVVNGWRIVRNGSPIETSPVSFNPSLNRIEIGKRGADLSMILKAATGDFISSGELQKRFPLHAKKMYEDIGAQILNYEIPIYTIETIISDGEENKVFREMGQVFTRINSAGVKIGKLEMFLSFFAGAGASTAKMQISTVWDQLEKQTGLELEPILRCVFFNMGLKQHELTKVESFDRALTKIQKQNLDYDTLIAQSKKGIQLTLDFLREQLGITSIGRLSSQNVLIPLFQYFYKNPKPVGDEDKKNLVKWFNIASFRGIYSSSPDKKIEDDLAIINNGNQGFPLQELLEHMRKILRIDSITKDEIVREDWEDAYRRANGLRYRLLLQWLLFTNDADDWAGNKIDNNRMSVHHIFPEDFLEENLGSMEQEERDKLINAFPNLTLIQPEVNSQIGNTAPYDYLENLSAEALEKHLIPTDKRLWKMERYEDFLKQRAELLFASIERRLSA